LPAHIEIEQGQPRCLPISSYHEVTGADREDVVKALSEFSTKTQAAQKLGLSTSQLNYRIKKYGIQR
jgi:transcriptional regulator with GAF, ATPase, and Fis domain